MTDSAKADRLVLHYAFADEDTERPYRMAGYVLYENGEKTRHGAHPGENGLRSVRRETLVDYFFGAIREMDTVAVAVSVNHGPEHFLSKRTVEKIRSGEARPEDFLITPKES